MIPQKIKTAILLLALIGWFIYLGVFYLNRNAMTKECHDKGGVIVDYNQCAKVEIIKTYN